MSEDPYTILGVERTASADEIRKSYRRLAKTLHPDLNPGNKEAEEQFKTASAAYDLLSDTDERGRFDRGEIDGSGNERPRHRPYRDYAEADPAQAYAGQGGFDVDDDVLAEIFGRAARGTGRLRGADAQYRLELDFLDAVNGVSRAITLPDGAALDVTIPAGTRDGQVLRLRGKGRPGLGGGPPGDALIAIEVRPHPVFSRDGDDIRIELPVPLRVAVLGGEVTVPTTTGSVAMRVPKWTNTGRVLRLKGRGARGAGGTPGDQYVTLRVALPARPDPALEALIAQWQPADQDAGTTEPGS